MVDNNSPAKSLSKDDIKSVGWNFLMAMGGSATALLITYLPQVDFKLDPVKSTILMMLMPAVFAGIKLANKWFVDNTPK